MGDTIKIKKGQKSKLPVLQLAELGFTTDEERLYIGGLNGNVPIPNLPGREEICIITPALLFMIILP